MRFKQIRQAALSRLAAAILALGLSPSQAEAQTAPTPTAPASCIALPVVTRGNASILPNGQYQLTPAVNSQIGAIWSNARINLTQPFSYSAWIYLGADSSGADGMTFTLQNAAAGTNAMGQVGRGMGAGDGSSAGGGIPQSLIVEFDTYRNTDNGWNDPAQDHLAIYPNGDGRHGLLTGFPTPYVFPSTLKNNQYHLMRVVWTPSLLGGRLDVYLNHSLLQSYTVLSRALLFGGDQVYWGYTASTGGLNNSHRVCNASAPAPAQADYGDAPESYGQAWHLRPSGSNVNMGAAPSVETGPRTSADGRLDENDDSFFVYNAAPITWSGGTLPIVGSGGGHLNVWVDWNRDGLFAASERAVADLQDNAAGDLHAGVGDIHAYVTPRPDLMTGGEGLSFIRMRWSTQAGLGPTGEAPNGEVEDHPVNLVRPTTRDCTGSPNGSNFATTGAGLYKSEIFWLDWACGGVDRFYAGDVVAKTWTLPTGYRVRGVLSQISNPMAVSPLLNGFYDSLQHLYGGATNIGLKTALPNASSSPHAPFRLNLELFSPTGASTPYDLTTIAAEAEDLTGDNESLTLTVDAPGEPWRITDIHQSLSARFSNGGRTAYFENNPHQALSSVVLASPRGSQVDVILDPGGISGVAFGVMVGADHGDAPASYGAAAHLQTARFLGGSQPTTLTRLTSAHVSARSNVAALMLGALVDAEGSARHSADASGDDLDLVDDEDGVLAAPSFVGGRASEIRVQVVGNGYLSLWFDANRNGVFDAGERLVTDVQDNGPGDLDPAVGVVRAGFTTPLATLSGSSFMRLRWSASAGNGPSASVMYGEAEDYMVLATAVAPLGGTLFEDRNHGGGAGRAMASAPGAAPLAGAVVELYDAAGAYLASTTTDAAGAYGFMVPAGTYHVRPASLSIRSVRGSPSAASLGVQTFRVETNPSASPALRTVTGEVGGRRPHLQDAAANAGGASALVPASWSFTGGALAGGVAQSVSRVDLPAAGLSGVDFGYNFSSIVNTNDGGQGSLRQFLLNAALLERASLDQAANMLFDPPAGTETSIFNIPASDPNWSSGVATLDVASSNPTLNVPGVRINGLTQPGALPGAIGPASRRLVIRLRSAAGDGVSLLRLGPDAANTRIAGLVFEGGTAVEALGAASGTRIQGNHFGVSADGSQSTGSMRSRLFVRDARDWTIGVLRDGAAASVSDGMSDAMEGNLIAAYDSGLHDDHALVLEEVGGSLFRVAGNFFNLASGGSTALRGVGADSALIALRGARNLVVGGTDALERNLFAGPVAAGVDFLESRSGSDGMTLLGNSFGGLDASGSEQTSLRLGAGVLIRAASGLSLAVGDGTDSGANFFNVGDVGVHLRHSGVASAVIRRNRFGLSRLLQLLGARHASLGAIRVEGPAGDVHVLENLVTMGAGAGLVVRAGGGVSAQRVLIERNSFFGSSGLGIDLGEDGVTLNDAHDVDAGPNGLLNFPMLSSALLYGQTLALEGCAPAGALVELHEYDDSPASPTGDGLPTNSFGTLLSYGEGWRHLTSVQALGAACPALSDEDGNDGAGMSRFSLALDLATYALSPDSRITLTASLGHATSEFSPAYAFDLPIDLELSKQVDDAAPAMGFPVAFSLVLRNASSRGADLVQVLDALPGGYLFLEAVADSGVYDPATGEWSLSGFGGGGLASLILRAVPLPTGPWTNRAEVVGAFDADGDPLADLDSTPANGVPGEDDFAMVDVFPLRGSGSDPGAAVCRHGASALDWSAAPGGWPNGQAQLHLPLGPATAMLEMRHPATSAPFAGMRSLGAGGLSVQSQDPTRLIFSFPAPVEGLRLDLRGLGGGVSGVESLALRGSRAGQAVSAHLSGGASVSLRGQSAAGVEAASASGPEGAVLIAFTQPVDRIELDMMVLADPAATAPPFSAFFAALTACAPEQEEALTLTPDHDSTVEAGQLAIYAHRLRLGAGLAGSTLDFVVESGQGLDWSIFRDDGDGVHGAGDLPWPPGGLSGMAAGSHAFWLVAKTPAEAPGGWSDLTRLRAVATLGASVRIAEAQDLTRIGGSGSGGVFARKLQALDADCDGVPEAGEAGFVATELQLSPGSCAVYRILFENRGVDPIRRVRVADHTPSWMVYMGGSARILTHPFGLTPQTPTAPAANGEGPVVFGFDGDLRPGEAGSVGFGARLPPIAGAPAPGDPGDDGGDDGGN
ncbi:CshA/CshB family fibrillar adhesin-related protein [Neomegalonema sp.]|uniref:CshA/CshB family fibrillar adhesin-related protein n=1 Tax=Neomegalonema sp. TaxID=2039713 RepID=UPI00262784FA|nr:CshA/CshB family fibrillar adhesin-related protein [Neomegalonema sp.]MDD2868337.1 CshA/CshB family fibrillar adhesin-related protein [Neomegalonema sp.]